MSRSAREIAAIVDKRRRDRSTVMAVMREIRDVCNSDIFVPLPEMDRGEKPSVPNLILRAIDQTASRVSSVQPVLGCPPRDPLDDYSLHLSALRRDAITGWWENSELEIADAARTRWLIGYGLAPTIIRPSVRKKLPLWEIRDPLDTYPPPTTGNPVLDVVPADCAFVHRHTYSWLVARYPARAPALIAGRKPTEVDPGELFEVIEWFDQEGSVLVALPNAVYNPYTPRGQVSTVLSQPTELDRLDNRIGQCQVVIPQRITMDRPRGQFDGAVGMYLAHAKLMALGMIGTERDIFPDMFLAARAPGERPQFISGPPQDGRTGIWNEVEGTPMAIGQPMGQWVTNMLDRVERSEGITGGIPSEFGGESSTNIRTGRRGEQVLEAVINFPMAEYQKIMAYARREETKRAQALASAWFGTVRKTIYVVATNRSVTYTPDDDFESDTIDVRFPIAGTDANNLVVATGQMTGAGIMSQLTAMELSPFIRDAAAEDDRIQVEHLRSIAMAVLQAQAAGGAVTIADFARIAELVGKNKQDIIGAIMQAQQEAQERQASSGPPGTPTGPVEPGSPQAQPGMAPPGAGAEQPTQPAQQAPPNLAAALAMMTGGR